MASKHERPPDPANTSTATLPRPGNQKLARRFQRLSGPLPNGIRAKLERTVRVGAVAAIEKEGIEAIFKTREVVELMNPGTPVNMLYEVAHGGLEAQGYGDYLPGRIGHAIGLGNHEDFSIHVRSSLVSVPGMSVALGPRGQVPCVCTTQFLDTVLITTDGHEHLTSPPMPGIWRSFRRWLPKGCSVFGPSYLSR